MAYLTGSRSQFPEQLDTILELFNLPPSQKDNAARYQYLATKENLSSLEQTELNNLSVILQDYLPDVETWNLFGDILINMQKFFKEGVEPFVNDLKDNALNEIEDKKQDIIDYMDSTEAGLIRNDIGVMGDSTIEGRSLIEKTNKLKDDINTLDNDKANKSDLNIHVNNALLHASYGTTSGTVNDYSAVVSPIPDSYKNGMRVTVKMHAANTGASTLRLLNTSGAFLDRVPLKKANGNNITNLKKDGVYTFVYSDGNFILQGEGGEYGTAQASDVLAGKTIGTENGIVTGTMPNRGAISNTITTQGGQITIPQGYHDGRGIVKAQFANLIASNIRKGVNIGGVVGDLQPNTYQHTMIPINEDVTINRRSDNSWVYKTVNLYVRLPSNIRVMYFDGDYRAHVRDGTDARCSIAVRAEDKYLFGISGDNGGSGYGDYVCYFALNNSSYQYVTHEGAYGKDKSLTIRNVSKSLSALYDNQLLSIEIGGFAYGYIDGAGFINGDLHIISGIE